jgi:ribosomal protein S18 acetylase RimI-like enzyme
MEIRRARVDDAAAIAEQTMVVANEGRWIATEGDRSVEELAERFRSGIEAGHIVFALVEGSRIVGAIGIHPTGVKGVHGLGMSILPQFRGRGWGQRLVDAALDAARHDGVRKVELEVFTDNGRAIGLYVRSGFEVEGVRRDHYTRLDGSLRSVVLMARFLVPAD